jgi:Ca-activated chloride channel family protein
MRRISGRLALASSSFACPRLLLVGPLLLSLAICFFPALAAAQGVLVVVDPEQRVPLPRPIVPHLRHPRPVPPPVSYKIKELSVQARLVDQVARVQVSQSFVNTGSRQMEVSFVFPLPYDGAIDQLTLLVDGKEYPAKLLPAKEARETYESIVRKNRDPALLEWVGTGMFQTSVFPVPPGAERTVTLRYAQLCRKDRGLTDFLFPLSTAKYTSHPVEKVEIRVNIESGTDIKNVYSPTHSVEIKRPDDRHATAVYTAKNEIPGGDFRLFYDVDQRKLGASVLSYRPDGDEDGYFLLLASPQIKAPDEDRTKKTVIFVVDRSGSMSGKKIEQAREALKFVLNNLREGDLFNIVAYDSAVESFRPELERYNDETRKAAIGFAEGLYAGGGTNIDGALQAALKQLADSQQPSYVLFLTDGLPTVGETGEMKIVANAKQHNRVRARIISLGVGHDVNSRLLDRLVRENYGQSEYVRPDEDIEAHVSRVYGRISSPVMTDVAVKYEFDERREEEGRPINRVFPKEVRDLFAGEQLVLVGRYRKPGNVKVVVSGSVGGRQQQFDFAADLAKRSHDDSYSFVEKLWAMRRIGEIIDELDLKGKNDELVQELVSLSTKHGILTPYTSFLADENAAVRDLAENVGRARTSLELLGQAEGQVGFTQRAEKLRFQTANQPQSATTPLSDSRSGEKNPLFGGFDAGGAGVAGVPADAAVPAALSARGAAVYRDAQDRLQVAERIKNVGSKSFYFRAKDQQWVDSTVTEEMERSAVRVTQFSDDYFKLAEQHGKAISQYLALDEPVLVSLAGQAYLIEPEKK